MNRFRINAGSVFVASLGNGKKKYFQFICLDITQLNSEVIRVFEGEYPAEALPDLDTIISAKVEFYSHIFIRLGAKLDLWDKVGNTEVPNSVPVWFRTADDYGRKVGEPPIMVSNRWWVWKVGKERKFVGRLPNEYKSAEIGLVFPPDEIIERMKTGRYSIEYPAFE